MTPTPWHGPARRATRSRTGTVPVTGTAESLAGALSEAEPDGHESSSPAGGAATGLVIKSPVPCLSDCKTVTADPLQSCRSLLVGSTVAGTSRHLSPLLFINRTIWCKPVD